MINLREREREKEEYKREIELEKKKKKKNIQCPKIDILKLVGKLGDIKIKSYTRANLQFAVHRSPSLEDLRCNIGALSLRVGSDHAKWIRRGVLCLSFSLSPRAQFMIGQHTGNGFTIRLDGPLPPPSPLYKNRRAEIVVGDIFI